MTYDVNYTFPYFQPWRCSGGTSGTPCAFNSPQSLLSQNNNGILDLNVSGIRFGLMTFDGISAYGRDVQVEEDDWDDPRSRGIDGLWSYGGRQEFRYPGCPNPYYMDTGARSSSATEGALISLESCSGPGLWHTCCESVQACPHSRTVNRDIRSALATRPFVHADRAALPT